MWKQENIEHLGCRNVKVGMREGVSKKNMILSNPLKLSRAPASVRVHPHPHLLFQ